MRLSDFNDFGEKINKDVEDVKQKTNKDVADLFDKYKNFSQTDLINELKNNVEKQKEDGSFDYDKLSSQAQNVMPFLNEDQKKSLLTILQQLK